MPSATISFAGYSFDNTGTPQWGRRTDFEQQGDGLPRIARSTFTVKQTFTEQSFGDNEAQIHRLNVALSAGEGLLLIKDENGVELVNQIVKVKSHDVPEAWRQYVADVTVSFEGRDLLTVTETDASFTPTGGTAIILPNIQEWKQAADIQRFSDERANRKGITVAITGSGFILADKSLSLAARRAALQAIARGLRGCSSRDGLLVYAGDSNTVKVDKIEADLADGSERLNWSFSCSYKFFPSAAGYAEVDLNTSSRDDYDQGQRLTTIRGNVRASDEATGKAKAEQIRLQYALPTRIAEHAEVTDARVSGADGDSWIDLTFDFEFSERIPLVISYDLTVATRQDMQSGQTTITYSGKVTADNSADAITQARALGLGKYPVMLSSEESLVSRKTPQSDERFIEISFSYEYQIPSTFKYAEFNRQITTDTFGDSHEVLSGYAVALTEADARAFVASFKLDGRLLREQQETINSKVSQGSLAAQIAAQVTRFDFSYTYYLTPASVSLSYGREVRMDYDNLETITTISGTARGQTETACRSAIDALMTPAPGALFESSRTPTYEKQLASAVPGSAGAGTQLISVAFSDSYRARILNGPLISQAEFTKKTQYSVNKAVITTIPYGIPLVQPGVGWTPGLITVSGSVTSLTEAGARAWGRGKRPALGSGGYEDPPEESLTSVNLPNDSVTIKNYRFDFTYSARFAYLPFA